MIRLMRCCIFISSNFSLSFPIISCILFNYESKFSIHDVVQVLCPCCHLDQQRLVSAMSIQEEQVAALTDGEDADAHSSPRLCGPATAAFDFAAEEVDEGRTGPNERCRLNWSGSNQCVGVDNYYCNRDTKTCIVPYCIPKGTWCSGRHHACCTGLTCNGSCF